MKRLACIALAACAACSRPETRVPAAPAPPPDAERTHPTVYCSLETRDHVLTLYVGGLYGVKTKDGRVLADEIDGATLARDYPELGELVERGPPLIDVDY